MKLILVEDNKGISEGLALAFEGTEYKLEIANNIKEARELVDHELPGLVLLDVSLPDGNGFDFYEMELSKRNIPTIFLTARDEENNIVRGLDLGAEDYITKPFSQRELMARVNRVFSRQKKAQVLRSHGVEYDLAKAELTRDGEPIAFSSLEIKIVQLLFENHNHVVSRDAVIDCIWEATGNDVYDHTVTVYMKRIREKMGVDVITTVKGLGYRIDCE